jgi:antitoxin HicB
VSSAIGARMDYPVELHPDDNRTFLVTFPDVPGAISYGDDRESALANAVDALETIISGLIADRRDVPAPSIARGGETVSPSLLGRLKVSVYRAMRERGWRKADLARAMALNPRQIDRLLDLRHGSTVAQLELALAACGKRAEVELRDLREAA